MLPSKRRSMDCNVAWESGNGWDPYFVAKHNNRRLRFGDSSAVALRRNAGLRRLRFRHLLLPLAACSQRRHVGRLAVLLQLRPDPLHAEDPRRAEARHRQGHRAGRPLVVPLAAPVDKGARIAELIVTPDGLPPQATPLLAANDVGKGDGWDRLRTGFYRLTG